MEKHTFNIDWRSKYDAKTTFIGQNGNSLIYKIGNKCIAVKEIKSLSRMTPEIQLQRKILAQEISHKALAKYSLKTKFDLITALSGETLLIKETEWIDNIVKLREIQIRQIIRNPQIMQTLIELNKFVLKQLFINKKLFDLVSTKYNSDGKSTWLNPNVYIGTKKGKNVIFIDSDWYFKLDDTYLTGFSKVSYLHVMLGGLITSSSIIAIAKLAYTTSKLWK